MIKSLICKPKPTSVCDPICDRKIFLWKDTIRTIKYLLFQNIPMKV